MNLEPPSRLLVPYNEESGTPPFSVGNTDVRTLYGTGQARAVLRTLRGQSARQHLYRNRAPAAGTDPRGQGADQPHFRPLASVPREHPQGDRGADGLPREGLHIG